MCGFVGYVNDTPDKSVNEKIIKDMADRIRHRGPDQDDYYVDSSVSLGFRRLSIIDLAAASRYLTRTAQKFSYSMARFTIISP
jgi:asparagine synthase (glutamine-hydrolysing)